MGLYCFRCCCWILSLCFQTILLVLHSQSAHIHWYLQYRGGNNTRIISGKYEKAEEDAIETQLQERATQFAQELVKVSTVQSGLLRSGRI